MLFLFPMVTHPLVRITFDTRICPDIDADSNEHTDFYADVYGLRIRFQLGFELEHGGVRINRAIRFGGGCGEWGVVCGWW